MKKTLQLIVKLSSLALSLALYLIGTGFHLWTVYIIYKQSGFISSAMSLFMPIFSEIYLLYRLTMEIGFMNYYSITLLSLIVAGIIFAAINNFTLGSLNKLEDNNKSN